MSFKLSIYCHDIYLFERGFSHLFEGMHLGTQFGHRSSEALRQLLLSLHEEVTRLKTVLSRL